MLRCAFAIAMAVLLPLCASGQDRSNYKLLWKISGNGLTKPSYLFGTMHVRDKRVFDFSDSVLLKIDECEAFALEVHPDSLVKGMLEVMLEKAREKDDISDQFSDPEFRYVDSLFVKRTGSSLRKFKSSRDLNSSFYENLGRKDMNTFLDAWLYNIARNQNKVILGLEGYHDHLSVLKIAFPRQIKDLKVYLENSDWDPKGKFESMVEMYHAGDIERLKAFSLINTTADYYEKLITRRNAIMADNIAKEIKEHSTFFAVGAAHLAGEDGIVNLLIKKGYSVTPVKPVFTGLAAKYKGVKTEQKWFAYSNAEAGYSVDMPSRPTELSTEDNPVKFQTSFDITSLTLFMSADIPTFAPTAGKDGARVLDVMGKAFTGENRIKSNRPIKVVGFEGREIEFTNGEYFFRLQMVLREARLYMLMVGGTDQSTRSDDANRFLTSFKALPLAQAAAPGNFISAEGAFSIDMPSKVSTQFMTPEDATTGKRYKIYVFHSADPATGEAFLIRYNDFPASYVSPDDTLYMQETLQAATTMMKGTDVRSQRTTYRGFPCLKFHFTSMEGHAKVSGYMIMRGNRFYLGLTTRSSTSSPDAADKFLNSLHFLPYANSTTKLVSFEDVFSMRVPEKFEQDSSISRDADVIRYSYVDANSGMPFVVQVENFSPYDEAKSIDEYFESISSALFIEADSVIRQEPITNGREYWVASRLVNSNKRVRYVIAGDKIISLWSHLPSDHEQSNLPSEVFGSFNVTYTSKWSLLDDKTGTMLHDLSSSDSVTCVAAKAALASHKFRDEEISKIYEALRKNYRDDGKPFGSTKSTLLNALTTRHDHATGDFIRDLYNTLPDSGTTRDVALEVLVSLKTEKDLRTMVALMHQDTIHQFRSNWVLSDLYDSLELLSPVLLDLLELEGKFNDAAGLLSLTQAVVDSGLVKGDARERVIRKVIDLANHYLREPRLAESDPEYYHQRSKLLGISSLLTSLPFTSDVKDLLIALHSNGDPEMMFTTSLHLTRHNVAVNSVDFDRIAASPLHRLPLYEELKKVNKVHLMNKRFLTPRMIAEGDIYEHLAYYDTEPANLIYVGEKKVRYKGELQRVFLFKYNIDGDEWYMCMGGPYSLKRNADVVKGELTTDFFEEYESDKQFMERVWSYMKEKGGTVLR